MVRRGDDADRDRDHARDRVLVTRGPRQTGGDSGRPLDGPGELSDAGRIDGCSELRIFWSVILPSVKPAMATLLIIKFMWSWNEFFWPMVVTSSPQMKVVTMGLMSFTNMYFIEYNLLTAAAVISVLPILLIFITLQRWVIQAVVMSGLKG